jgi:hypothetical protein
MHLTTGLGYEEQVPRKASPDDISNSGSTAESKWPEWTMMSKEQETVQCIYSGPLTTNGLIVYV